MLGGRRYRVELATPRPDDELADAARAVGISGGREWRETLVVVGVARDDDVGAGLVERLPERLHGRLGLDGAEERVVEEREGAIGLCCCEVGAEPALLFRAGRAGDLAAARVRVQADHVPLAEVEAVVPLPGLAALRAEVREVARRVGRAVLVVSRHRVDPRLVAAPGRPEAVLELDLHPGLVRGVPEDGDLSFQRVEELLPSPRRRANRSRLRPRLRAGSANPPRRR